jgi:transposase
LAASMQRGEGADGYGVRGVGATGGGCRPHINLPPSDLSRAISAIFWRHRNGTKWRALTAKFGPWRMGTQSFIRCARPGLWQRLLARARSRGPELGMAFLEDTSIRVVAIRQCCRVISGDVLATDTARSVRPGESLCPPPPCAEPVCCAIAPCRWPAWRLSQLVSPGACPTSAKPPTARLEPAQSG